MFTAPGLEGVTVSTLFDIVAIALSIGLSGTMKTPMLSDVKVMSTGTPTGLFAGIAAEMVGTFGFTVKNPSNSFSINSSFPACFSLNVVDPIFFIVTISFSTTATLGVELVRNSNPVVLFDLIY